MNNANTGTSKQINVRQWNDAGTVILWNKNYYGSTRVWVVTAPELSPAAISRQYICKNNHSAPVNVNCGKHYYWE